MSNHARAEGRLMQANRARQRAADLAPLLEELRGVGLTSATSLAKELTRRCIPTARGSKEWSASQVIRVIAKVKPSHRLPVHLLQD